jgi:hypothetical protein
MFSFEREFGGKNALAGGRFNPAPAPLIYTDLPEMMTPIENLPADCDRLEERLGMLRTGDCRTSGWSFFQAERVDGHAKGNRGSTVRDMS